MHNLGDFTIGTNNFASTSEICFDVLTTDDHVSEGTETVLFQPCLSTDVSWVVVNMEEEDPIIEIIIRDNDGMCCTKTSYKFYNLQILLLHVHWQS